MFLSHVKNVNSNLLLKVKSIIDIDLKKTNLYMQFINIKIISPQKYLNLNNKNDLIVVTNPEYYDEVKYYLKTECKNMPILKKV